MWYLTLKHLHVGAVIVSGALFALRGVWMLGDSPRLRHRWVRIVPHVVDTVLLCSAVALAVVTVQYPLRDGWLTAKVAALIVYVVLGSVALRRGRTKRIRVLALVGALMTFAYIVAVALRRQPLPF